jgi:hypothetical protein
MKSRFAALIFCCATLAILPLPALAIDSTLKPGLWVVRVAVLKASPVSWIRAQICTTKTAPPPDIDRFMATHKECKFKKPKNSATELSWDMSCKTGTVLRTRETLTRPDNEHQTLHMIMTSKTGDAITTNDSTVSMEWVSADCGDVKPSDGVRAPGDPPPERMLDFGP